MPENRRGQSAHSDRAPAPAMAGGFTGTLPEFLDALRSALAYGHLRVTGPVPAEHGRRQVHRIETVTGGYSADEALLARMDRTPLWAASWRSSHAGGLRVYEVPLTWIDDPDQQSRNTWLDPDDGHFETVGGQVRVVVAGTHVATLPGAVLSYARDGRRDARGLPIGELRIEPALSPEELDELDGLVTPARAPEDSAPEDRED